MNASTESEVLRWFEAALEHPPARREAWLQAQGLPASVHDRVQRLRSFDAGGRQRVFAIGGGVAELDGDRWRPIALPAALHGREQFDIAIEPARDGRAETLWIASYGPGLYRCVAHLLTARHAVL